MIKALSGRSPAKLSRQLLAVLVGSISAIIVNLVYYFILRDLVGIEFIAPEQFPPPAVSPLPASDVVIFSAVFCSGASVLFLILASISRRPAIIFITISLIVLVLSLFLPFLMPTPPIPISTEASLASMHIVGAAVLVPLMVVIDLPITSIDPEET